MPYVGFSARTNTAALRFGVPLAMFPALLYAARRTAHVSRASAFRAILAGALLTVVACGWVAPSIEHRALFRQQAAYVKGTGLYLQRLDWETYGFPTAKTLPELIHGAVAPDIHRYPGYPNYIAPEDGGAREFHRFMIYDHLFLTGLAIVAGILGWIVGRWRYPILTSA